VTPALQFVIAGSLDATSMLMQINSNALIPFYIGTEPKGGLR